MSRMIAFAAVRGIPAAGRRSIARLGGAVALLALSLGMPGGADAADKLVLQLHGPAQFEFAGYYAALWKNFYADSGLNVEIRPGAARGQTPIDPVKEVTEGRAQFGTGDTQLVIRTGQGLPLLLLAPIFQESGAAVYYRAEGDFASPGALLKARLGRLPASDILDIELATALRGEGIDPAKIKSVPLAPGQTVSALAERTVDAAIGSAWDTPFLARERRLALKSFNPADYRVEFYGDALFALRRFERTEPATVRRFRDASLKGWAYALDHPDEIIGRLVAEKPPAGITDPAGFARYQAEIARRLSRYPDIPLGHSSPDRWSRIEASMVDAGALVRTADPDSFLYDPDGESRGRADRRTEIILSMTGAAIVAITGLMLWLGHRRRGAAAASPAPAVATAAPPPAPLPPPLPTPAAVLTEIAGAAPAPPPAATDLNAMLTALEPSIRQRAPAPITVRLSLLPELWRCRAERELVAGLVLDLVGAAVADLRGGADLIVGTRNYAFDSRAAADLPGARVGEFARITVRDSGPGLSDTALERIFDPTVTARPTVAAAWPVLRQLGGFARVESAEGIGTAVHLYFPREIGEDAPGDATPADTVGAGIPAGRRYRASGSRATQRRSRSLR